MPKALNITDEEKQQRFKQQQRNASRKYYEKNKKYYNLVNARNRYIRLLNEEMNNKAIVSVIVHEQTIKKYIMKIDEYNKRIKAQGGAEAKPGQSPGNDVNEVH